jgi:hypothetical protein
MINIKLKTNNRFLPHREKSSKKPNKIVETDKKQN